MQIIIFSGISNRKQKLIEKLRLYGGFEVILLSILQFEMLLKQKNYTNALSCIYDFPKGY